MATFPLDRLFTSNCDQGCNLIAMRPDGSPVTQFGSTQCLTVSSVTDQYGYKLDFQACTNSLQQRWRMGVQAEGQCSSSNYHKVISLGGSGQMALSQNDSEVFTQPGTKTDPTFCLTSQLFSSADAQVYSFKSFGNRILTIGQSLSGPYSSPAFSGAFGLAVYDPNAQPGNTSLPPVPPVPVPGGSGVTGLTGPTGPQSNTRTILIVVGVVVVLIVVIIIVLVLIARNRNKKREQGVVT